LDQTPDAMRIRRQTVEHPYGTIKSWMGATHFLMKTLDASVTLNQAASMVFLLSVKIT
jgi:hypothetical protein